MKEKKSWSVFAGAVFLGAYEGQTEKGAIGRFVRAMGYRSAVHAGEVLGFTLRAVEVAS